MSHTKIIRLLFTRWKLLFQMGVTKTFALKNRAIKHFIIFVSLRGAFAEKNCLLCMLPNKDEHIKALMGLLALQYGLKLFPFGCPHFKKILNIVRDTSFQIVFVALEGKKMNLTMKWQEVFAVLAH